MDKLLKILRRGAILLTFAMFPIMSGSSASNDSAETFNTPEIVHSYTLKEVVVTAKKKFRNRKAAEFLGFKLEKSSLDTNIHVELEEALQDFTGPKVLITSLRRHKWNPESKHRSGRAVDFQFSHELIEWLVSEDGITWREKYGLTFYIEGQPGSSELKRYKSDEKYNKFVFENRYATGDHVHINL